MAPEYTEDSVQVSNLFKLRVINCAELNSSTYITIWHAVNVSKCTYDDSYTMHDRRQFLTASSLLHTAAYIE